MTISPARIFIILIILSATIFPFHNPLSAMDIVTAQRAEKSGAGSVSVYDRALKMYRRGEFREAIQLLRQKKTIDAGDANLLGWAYLKTGDADEAIRQFSRSVSLAPSSYDSYCGLGFSYMRTCRLREALDSFDKGTSGNSKDIDCLLGKGGVMERLEEKEKAADNFRETGYIDEVTKEIRNAIDAVHGDASIPHRYGHAHGIYKDDVSSYAAGFIFGREWEPYTVLAYNKAGKADGFNGQYLSISGSSPMEAWLTEMLDHVISYEAERYKTTRPAAYQDVSDL